jgi:hypothetical protein
MAEDIGTLILRIEADTKQLKSELGKVDSAVEDFSKSSKKSLIDWKGVAESALGFGFANLSMKAIESFRDLSVEAVKSSIEASSALQQLQFQVGSSASDMVANMRYASNNLVSDLDLMKNANKALALGIKKDDIPALLEVATARAKILGISAGKAFEDITTGVARNSKMILDNLGIVVDLDKANKEYAATIGKTADGLTEAEKKQALLNSTLKESETLIRAMKYADEDMLSSAQKLGVFWENYKKTLGDDIVAMVKFTSEMSGLTGVMTAFNAKAGDLMFPPEVKERILNVARAIQENAKQVSVLNLELNDTKKLYSDFTSLFQTPFKGQTGMDSQIADLDLQLQEVKTKKLDINAQDNYGIAAQTEQSKKLDEQTASLEKQREVLVAHRDLEIARMNALEKGKKIEMEKLVPQEKSLSVVSSEADKYLVGLAIKMKERDTLMEVGKIHEATFKQLESQGKAMSDQEVSLKKQYSIMAAMEFLSGGFLANKAAGYASNALNSLNKVTNNIQPTPTTNTQSPTFSSSLANNGGTTNVFNVGTLSSVSPNETLTMFQDMLNTKVR